MKHKKQNPRSTSDRLEHRAAARKRLAKLSPREERVGEYLARGYSWNDAQELALSEVGR